MIEVVSAVVAVAAAIVIGLRIGRSPTLSLLLVLIGGLGGGGLVTVMYFLITMTLGHSIEGILNPWLMGICLIAVGVAAPLGGVTTAFITHLRVNHADATRLPF